MLPRIVFLVIAISASLGQECDRKEGDCPDDCPIALMHSLPNTSFTASSEFNETTKASNVRFTSEGLWCPNTTDDMFSEYVTVDLGCVQPVCGVLANDSLLLFHALNHSKDGIMWEQAVTSCERFYIPRHKTFEGGCKSVIKPAIRARFFKFYYIIFNSFENRAHPCLKVELYRANDSVDGFEPVGCFHLPRKTGAMRNVYHTVKGVDKKNPDILAIYEECRLKAEESPTPIEVFGIRNYKYCATTESGKEDESSSSYTVSTKCAACRGKSIGAGKGKVFVYRKQN